MDITLSKEMIRYYKNKERYNSRAKIYFNEIYYPKKRIELLKKAKETNLLKKNCNHPRKSKYNNKCSNPSLIVSFD